MKQMTKILTVLMIISTQLAYSQDIFHPADSNQDWKVSPQEFETYNIAWKNKAQLPEGEQNILMDDVTRAGFIASYYEDYYYDETKEGSLRWIPVKGPIKNFLGMTFVYIFPGSFIMGSPEDELRRESDETQHRVILTKGFYLQTTEVTQAQWEVIKGKNPSSHNNCGEDCPVEQVTWNDVEQFIKILNTIDETDIEYRLPGESEWEYAARAGSTTALVNGELTEANCGFDANLDEIAWYCGNSNDTTHPIAQKVPNPWGIFDMQGNVWEFCQDWYGSYPDGTVIDPVGPNTGSKRVIRGGCFVVNSWNNAGYYRSASRHTVTTTSIHRNVGFRLAFWPVEQAR
jgi:formylglycine-generating enzyme required for sulfatase activity